MLKIKNMTKGQEVAVAIEDNTGWKVENKFNNWKSFTVKRISDSGKKVVSEEDEVFDSTSRFAEFTPEILEEINMFSIYENSQKILTRLNSHVDISKLDDKQLKSLEKHLKAIKKLID